jgi:urea carboxylase
MASALSITSPLQGTIWQLKVAVGDEVREGQELIIIESMKMEIELLSPVSGRVIDVRRKAGQSVSPGTPVVIVEETTE